MESDFVLNVRRSAEDSFASGLYCAESVVLAVADALGVESELLPKVATAFCRNIEGQTTIIVIRPTHQSTGRRAMKPRSARGFKL